MTVELCRQCVETIIDAGHILQVLVVLLPQDIHVPELVRLEGCTGCCECTLKQTVTRLCVKVSFHTLHNTEVLDGEWKIGNGFRPVLTYGWGNQNYWLHNINSFIHEMNDVLSLGSNDKQSVWILIVWTRTSLYGLTNSNVIKSIKIINWNDTHTGQ